MKRKRLLFALVAMVSGFWFTAYAQVAKIGSTPYATFAEAYNAAQAGETVTLLADLNMSEILVLDKAITLNGDGNKLTSTAGRAINVSGANGVTIKNLTINASGERAINVIQNATNVTIDNVTATAANYTVNIASSAPNAVVVINNSTLNGLCTVNVSAAGANVKVDYSTVNCNDNNTTEGESYAALCLNKDAVGGSIVATNTTVNVAEGSDSMKGRNGAEDGTVTINGSTDDVAVMVAAITYPGSDYYHSFASLAKAVEFAKAGDVITLIRDITASDIITIDKAITLDGNGKKLTSTATGTTARAINVSGANGVTIKNLTINANGERAINVIQNATNVTIDNVTATAANYTVNIAGSAPNAVVAIKNSTLNGLCTVNVGAAGAQVTVGNSTVNCNDTNTTEGESYAALCLNKEAVGGSIVATNTTIKVADGSDSYKGRNGAEDGTVTINGSTEGVVVMVAVITYDASPYYHSFASLAEAVEFAKAGDVITLIRDITASDIITIDKAITLDGNGKKLTSTAGRAINVETDGSVTISNLTINAGERAINIINKPATVELNGVTATAKNNAVMVATSAGAVQLAVNDCDFTGLAVVNVAGAGAQVTIADTKITNVDANKDENYGAITVWSSANGASVAVTGTGGEIVVADDSKNAYVFPADATVTGVDKVGYIVATVGDAGFDTLDEALEYAQAGSTIELVRDITSSEIIVIEKSVTINGNGVTLTSTATRAINIDTDGEVTINKMIVNAGERAFNIINKPATVELNGVTAIAKNNAVMVATSAGAVQLAVNDCDFTGLAVVNVAGAGAQVTIADTKITNVDANKDENYGAITVWSSANGASVAVTGGEIVIADDSKKAYVFPADATVTGVDEVGYIVATVGDAGFDTLDEALEYAQAGSTVELVRDITSSEIIVIEKSVTINGNGKKLTSTAARAINVSGANGVTIKNLTINANGERAINVIQNATNVTIDNVTATAANYTVNIAGSAPNAVVAINNSTLNGLCTVNVSSEGAKVTVDNSTVNCNDNNTTTGESYAALCLNKDAVGGSIVATNTIVNVAEGSDSMKGRNGAENGTVTINGSTEDVAVMVAAITYDASPYYHSFASLAKAVEFAKAGDVITLIRDITASDIITIDKAITLDGNGKTLTSTAGRAINVSGADGVTIKNLTINANGERAINVIQNATNVTIDNVTATAANYTVNLAGSAPNAVVAINNSTLNGLCTVNVSSEGAKVTVDNSTVNCNDNNTTTGESYAALCLNKEAVGGSIVATNTTIKVADGSDSYKGRNGAEDGTVTINGSTEGVVVMVAVITYDASPYYHSFASLAKAVEFAKAGDVITLIRDITSSEIIVIEKSVTINGNGKTLTSTAGRAINVSGADGEVIIKNLAIVAESCEEFAVVTDNAGNVKLEECEIEYTRTFAALNTWYALYVPFEISIDAEFLENYDVAKFTGLNVYDNSNMSMSVQLVESGSLEANTPYLIRVKNEEAKTLSVTVNKAGFNSESLTFEDGSITASFSGTYTETVASEIEGAYAMSGGLFRKAADDEQILKPFRFYLMLTDNSTPGQALSLRSVAIRFDNEQDGTTAIEKTQTSEEAIVIYDLTGRRVMEPQEGEIYIINGKKVLF